MIVRNRSEPNLILYEKKRIKIVQPIDNFTDQTIKSFSKEENLKSIMQIDNRSVQNDD